MKTVALVILTGAVVFAPGMVAAEVYKWVDEKGQVHYSDRASAPAADKVTLPASPPAPKQATPSPADTSRFPVTPEEQEAFRLKMEYQQRRNEENARRYREEERKRELESTRKANESVTQYKRTMDEMEAARRKAVVENCRLEAYICRKGYEEIMRHQGANALRNSLTR